MGFILDLIIALFAGWVLFACAKWVVANKQNNKRKDDARMRNELRKRNGHGE